ncbi:MAG TPA: DUF6677 family protein [Blastocatellia bacterium]|nr:DUF6677 family protein [Blastocatellia bacterium]
MQTRDDLSGDVPRVYRDASPYEAPRAYPAGRRMAAVLLGWLVPGAGHLILGKLGRGLLFLVLLTGTFVLGLALHGRLFWPTPAETPSALYFDLITVLWFLAQVGSGLCYIISYLFGFGTTPIPEAATFEYGNTFLFLAGLLNYLVIYDAYDIAAGRKR